MPLEVQEFDTLELQGPRDLSPLEKDAIYTVFAGASTSGVNQLEPVLPPSELQLEVVESIGGPGGQGLRNSDQEMVGQSIQRSPAAQQWPREREMWRPWGGVKLTEKQTTTWGAAKQVSVDSTYDRSGVITMSRSAFPHTDNLHKDLPSRYRNKLKPANIHYLSTFIYQCTRYWQWVYDERREPIPKSGSAYHFTERQLTADRLPGLVAERHASAAQVYFAIVWQLQNVPWIWIEKEEKERKFADIDLTSGPPENKHSVGPLDRYDRIAGIPPTDGRRIVTYKEAQTIKDSFKKYIDHLQKPGPRKHVICAEAMQATQIDPGSRFYDPL